MTALTAAAARAAHLIVDDEPCIFADTRAEAMLGERAEEFIAYHRAHGTHPVLADARAQVTCRSRYTEDRLAEAIECGIGQYVLLGAGLDSFAYRSPLAGRVRVFEVDHPATQEWKRQVAAGSGSGAAGSGSGAAGDGVMFVPVDFTRDSLANHLGRAGFDATRPAFVSWLGVTVTHCARRNCPASRTPRLRDGASGDGRAWFGRRGCSGWGGGGCRGWDRRRGVQRVGPLPRIIRVPGATHEEDA